LGEAIDHYEKAIAAPLPSLFALNDLAWILSTCSDASFRNGPRGVELAQQAVQFSGGKNPSFLRTLAAAYAETGRFNDAIETVSRALQLAKEQHDTALADELQQDVDLYHMKFPLRQHSLTNTRALP
jgi:tetratricopeptide (TPR) repeat protein